MILLIAFCLLVVSNQAFAKIELSRLNISDRLEVVFVKGDEEARMNHVQAFEFCKNLTNYLNVTSSKEQPYVSDLLSIHDPYMMSEKVMPWLIKINIETFWIGGVLKIMHRHHRNFPVSGWTDRSTFSFKNFHHHLVMLRNAEVGQKLCIMIGYTSGRWGVERCWRRMFFMCQIARPNLPIDVPIEEKALKPAMEIEKH